MEKKIAEVDHNLKITETIEHAANKIKVNAITDSVTQNLNSVGKTISTEAANITHIIWDAPSNESQQSLVTENIFEPAKELQTFEEQLSQIEKSSDESSSPVQAEVHTWPLADSISISNEVAWTDSAKTKDVIENLLHDNHTPALVEDRK